MSIFANAACEPVDSGQGAGGEGGEVWGQGGAVSSSGSGQPGTGGQGSAGSSSGGGSGQAGAGGAGGGEACLDGQMQSCYTGPIGTENSGPCHAGARTCVGGIWSTCTGEVTPVAEICDYIDNDCDGQVNESNPCNTGKWGVCAIGSTQCMFGTSTCNEVNVPSPEICDNLDNDCNGLVDDGDPGGMPCPTAQIDCGVFVGPVGVGAPGNPGTQAQPLSTIADAQVIAAMDGSDICLCDTPDITESVFEEDVTMIEGISIYGGYDCTNWMRDLNTYVTTIKGGVYFPGGITSATTLGGLIVRGKDYTVPMQQPEFSTAITISDSSPRLIDVKASGGIADYSLGLGIGTSNGGAAAPIVIGGMYSANGNGYGAFAGQTGISVWNAGGTFVNVTAWADGSGDGSTGFSCSNCSAFISGSKISGGYSQKYTDGISVSGNANGLFITNTTINGGSANGGSGYATGIAFSDCTGSPTLNGVTIDGGSSPGFATGFSARGPSCTPIITNSSISGGSATFGTIGVDCYDNAACVVTNSIIDAGSSNDQKAVVCNSNGCGVFAGNTIKTKTVFTSSGHAVAIHLANTSPTFENNTIHGAACSSQVSPMARLETTHIENSTAAFTNNVFLDQPCTAGVELIHLKAAGALLHNNTIQFTTCNGCGPKVGLFVDGSTNTARVRNNIFFNAGTADFANAIAIAENTTSSDLAILQNNLLWAPNGGTLYLNEGSTALQLPAINALSGATGNISANPMLDATLHLLAGSPCRNAGTATGAPLFDFETDPRPQEGAYDIGADEYVP